MLNVGLAWARIFYFSTDNLHRQVWRDWGAQTVGNFSLETRGT